MERKLKGAVPDAAEFGQLRAALARLGVKPGELTGAVGSAPSGRTREKIAGEIRTWLRTRGR